MEAGHLPRPRRANRKGRHPGKPLPKFASHKVRAVEVRLVTNPFVHVRAAVGTALVCVFAASTATAQPLHEKKSPAPPKSFSLHGVAFNPVRRKTGPAARPSAWTPNAAELAALKKIGIVPSDPQYKTKLDAYLKQRAAAWRVSHPARQATANAPVIVHMPNPHLVAQRATGAKMRHLLAHYSIANLTKGGRGAVIASSTPTPFPEVKSWNVNGNFVQNFPTTTPNNNYEVSPGDQIMFTGRSLGGASAPPAVVLNLSGCGKVNLNVTSTAPDGSYVVAKVPTVFVAWPKWRGYITVNGATGPRLVYDAPMDTMYVMEWVRPPQGYTIYPNAQSVGTGHAFPVDGMATGSSQPANQAGLVEGTSMNTSDGPGNRGIQTVAGVTWPVKNGAHGTDTFGTNVPTVNGWTIVTGGVAKLWENWLTGGAGQSGCEAGFLSAPFFKGISLPYYSVPAGNPNNLYSTVYWSFSVPYSVIYDVSWELQGPSNTRPLSSMPKVGQNLCEN